MKKAIALLLCMVCILGTFVGCEKIEPEPKTTSKSEKIEKTLACQEDVPDVFKIEKCEFNSDQSIVTTQLRNDSKKVMNSFLLLYKFFDKSNNFISEIYTPDDIPLFAGNGELTHENGYSVEQDRSAKRIEVYVANISYKDGTRWINEELVLSEKSQVAVKMEKEIVDVFKIEQCKMDIVKFKFQLKNLSATKTIKSYSVLIRYLDVLEQEYDSKRDFDYDGVKVKPNEISERKVWSIFPGQYKTANCYVTKIVYTDGTQWDNPNIPPIET